MDFKKITISLPETLYNEGMMLINNGFFSNFSDLVRSGIREELKEIQPILKDFDERVIYNDKELIAGVMQSSKELKAGKGRKFSSEAEMDKYFEEL